MQDNVLESLLVADSMTKITVQNLWNFFVKFGSKAEICGKLEELKWTPKFQVLCWDIYYFSERLRCRLSNKHKITNELQLWGKNVQN
jgi:hypothetical protein